MIRSMLMLVAYVLYIQKGNGFSIARTKVFNNIRRATATMVTESSFGSDDNAFFLEESEKSRIRLFEATRPSVVYISKLAQAFNPMLMNVMEIPAQTGSGFVWDDKHIVTNYHVIGTGTNEVQVTFVDNEGNREAHRATVRGFDADKDVAVLRLQETSNTIFLKPIAFTSSQNLRVGQSAIAIGNPFGLDHTLTTGVISGLDRQIATIGRRPIFNMIQTDAAINPGNSGGPLLDSMGRLIGMNTAIYSTSGASAGIGFAIPSDTLKVVVDTIIRDGKVVKPATGIQYLGGGQSKALGIDKGIVILGVSPGSAAERAGLRGISKSMFSPVTLGDIITAVDGKTIITEADFLKVLYGKKVGDEVELSVLRSSNSRGGGNRAGTTQLKDAIELKVRLKLQPFEEVYASSTASRF